MQRIQLHAHVSDSFAFISAAYCFYEQLSAMFLDIIFLSINKFTTGDLIAFVEMSVVALNI